MYTRQMNISRIFEMCIRSFSGIKSTMVHTKMYAHCNTTPANPFPRSVFVVAESMEMK